MRGHETLFRPSSASLWRTCSLSPHMAAAFPESSDEASAEGTMAHAVAAATVDPLRPMPAGADADMLRAARTWSETIGEVPAASVEVWMSGDEPDFSGTADHATRDVVADFKFGRAPVEVFDNPQLLAYAELLDPTPRPLELVIVQPRAAHPDGPVRRHSLTTPEVAAHFADARAARERARADPRATPGAHCLHCPGRAHCRGLRTDALRDLEVLNGPDLAETLARARAQMEMVKGLVSGIEAETESRLSRGERVGNWEMVPGRALTRWNVTPEEAIAAVALDTGKNIGRIEVCTPTQAREEHGVPQETINRLAKRHLGAARLTFINPKSIQQKLKS